jgi:hypothetical protein
MILLARPRGFAPLTFAFGGQCPHRLSSRAASVTPAIRSKLGRDFHGHGLILVLFCRGTAPGVHLPARETDNRVNFYENRVMAGGFYT